MMLQFFKTKLQLSYFQCPIYENTRMYPSLPVYLVYKRLMTYSKWGFVAKTSVFTK